MKIDRRSIAKIFRGEAAAAEFHGTGFLVTQDHVVTCAHVVSGHHGDLLNREGVDERDPIGCLSLHFGNHADRDAWRTGELIALAPPDLALIRLDRPVASQPLPLVFGLTSRHKTAFSGIESSVIGFSETAQGKLIERPIDSGTMFIWDFDTREMLSLQVIGGLSPGMSGSPLMVESGKPAVCFGMAYLGGDCSAMSRLIASQELIDFLTRNHISPRTIPAAECVPVVGPEATASAKRWFTKAPAVFLFVLCVMRPLVVQAPETIPAPAPVSESRQDIKPLVKYLSDDQVRIAIDQALKKPDVQEAVRLLSGMSRGAAKSDECERIYGATRNGGMLSWATAVVNQCWTGAERQTRLAEISTKAIHQ